MDMSISGIFGGVSAKITPYDINCFVNVPIAASMKSIPMKPIYLGNLSALSVSSFRDKTEVRIVGETSPVGMCGGPRTVAGTLVFSSINKWVFHDIYKAIKDSIGQENGILNRDATTITTESYSLPDRIYADELPPFDIYVIGGSETGVFGYFKILGVSILGQSSAYDVNTLKVDTSYTYKAINVTDWEYKISNLIKTNGMTKTTTTQRTGLSKI